MTSDTPTTPDTHPESQPWCRIVGIEDNGPRTLKGFDDLFAKGVDIHIERMNSGHYWMRIEKDGQSQRIEMWAKGGRLYSGTERE